MPCPRPSPVLGDSYSRARALSTSVHGRLTSIMQGPLDHAIRSAARPTRLRSSMSLAPGPAPPPGPGGRHHASARHTDSHSSMSLAVWTSVCAGRMTVSGESWSVVHNNGTATPMYVLSGRMLGIGGGVRGRPLPAQPGCTGGARPGHAHNIPNCKNPRLAAC